MVDTRKNSITADYKEDGDKAVAKFTVNEEAVIEKAVETISQVGLQSKTHTMPNKIDDKSHREPDDDALQKLYESFRHKRLLCLIFLGVWGLRLPALLWLMDEKQILASIWEFRDLELCFVVPMPLMAALSFLLFKRTQGAVLGTILCIISFVFLLDYDPQFALSRPEIMCALITMGVIWTIWSLIGRIKVLESIGCGKL